MHVVVHSSCGFGHPVYWARATPVIDRMASVSRTAITIVTLRIVVSFVFVYVRLDRYSAEILSEARKKLSIF